MNAARSEDVQSRAAASGSSILTTWRAQREAERQAVRNDTQLTDPRVRELLGSMPASAGVYVTPGNAMRVSAVAACVALIGGTVSNMPAHVYRRTANGRDRVKDDPLWWLLNEQPTARFTAASWWEMVINHNKLRGDHYAFIKRTRLGDVKEFVPLPWEGVETRRVTTADSDRLVYYVNDGMRTFGVDQDDMLHFPGFGFDGLRSMSVIGWAARNAAGTAMAMDEYSGKFFAGGAHPSFVIQTDKEMKKETIEQLQRTFANKYSGVNNFHQLPLVLTDGLKASPLSITAEDSQLLDARKFQVIDIARAFGIPPHMIGETSASTSWGTGIEAMSRQLVQTVNRDLIRIEQELNRKLFRNAGRYIEFNRDALLDGDSKSQAQYFRAALGGPGTGRGWMAVDEVRALKNMPPMGGPFAEVYDPPANAPGSAEPKEPDDEPPADPNAPPGE